MTDPNGVVTIFTYDARERILSRTVRASSGNATTSFTYDSVGNITRIILPDHSFIDYYYDNANRIAVIQNTLGYIDYSRDNNGDITQEQVGGNKGLVKTQSAAFDSLGRMLQQIGASGQTSSFTYDANGNLLTVVNPLRNTKTSAFDALNRLVSQLDPLSNKTAYAYDAQDNLDSVTDPRNLITTYTYDGFGQVIAQSSPDSGTTTYTLDKAGNRVSETDARGVVTNRTFDALNRVLTETYPASASENIAYTYDFGKFGIARLTGVTDESGSASFTYNERGDVLTDTRITGGYTYVTKYTYNLADNIMSISYPSGDLVTYTRDSNEQVSSVSYKPSGSTTTITLAKKITYEPFGPVLGLTYGNGLTGKLTYDQDYRLTGILTKGTADIQNLSLVYDGANDITSIKDKLDATGNQTFTYDKDYHLLTANGKYGALAYTYDADGNRISSTAGAVASSYNYPTTSNQLSSIVSGSSTRNLSYAANGDIVSDSRNGQAVAFTYGNRNRNEQVSTAGSGTVVYKYNAFGQRMLKMVGAVVTSYQYDLKGHLIAESNGATGIAIREYILIDDMPLAQIEANGTIYYIHNDQTGTPQKMTDASQNVVWDRIQQPFGETVSITGNVTDNLRFPGQYADSESGLNDNLNRSYDPTLGRYTQGDPIGLLGGMNVYEYAMGNPLKNIDPIGLFGVIVNLGAGAQAGDVNNGGVASASVNAGEFLNINPFSDDFLNTGNGSTVTTALSGYSGRAYDYSPNSCNEASSPSTTVYGASVNVGPSLSFTNANNVGDLEGPFNVTDLTLGFLNIQISTGYSNQDGSFIFEFTIGEGIGLSYSSYQSNTVPLIDNRK